MGNFIERATTKAKTRLNLKIKSNDVIGISFFLCSPWFDIVLDQDAFIYFMYRCINPTWPETVKPPTELKFHGSYINFDNMGNSEQEDFISKHASDILKTNFAKDLDYSHMLLQHMGFQFKTVDKDEVELFVNTIVKPLPDEEGYIVIVCGDITFI